MSRIIAIKYSQTTAVSQSGFLTYHAKQGKGNLFFFVLICCLLYSGVSDAQKIGYVNMNILINESPQIIDANRQLTQEFEQQNNRITQQESDLKLLEDEITKEGPLMTADALAKLQERARILERQVRRSKEDLNDAITIRNSQLVENVQQQIKEVVSAYAKENGYDVILINAILYASDEVNLTDEILQRLKRDFKKE